MNQELNFFGVLMQEGIFPGIQIIPIIIYCQDLPDGPSPKVFCLSMDHYEILLIYLFLLDWIIGNEGSTFNV